MAFVKKTWVDRLTEFPGRRRLTDVATSVQTVVDVERNEGEELKEGDKINAANLNGLEQRIADDSTAQDAEITKIIEQLTPMTQAQYNALPNKENRLYFIKG